MNPFWGRKAVEKEGANYQSRLNVLNGRLEFLTKQTEAVVVAGSDARWQTLTERDLNGIIIEAKKTGHLRGRKSEAGHRVGATL